MTPKESHIPFADTKLGALGAPLDALGLSPDGVDAMKFKNERTEIIIIYDKLEPLEQMAPLRLPNEKPFRTAASGHGLSTTRVKRALFKDVFPLKESNA